MTKNQVYFPNLNGLRFIAAFLVIIHHIEQIKLIRGLDSLWSSTIFVVIIGKLGVVLFFTLSGFLITYLLLAEEKTSMDINIRNFYIRRILKIWPLYFVIIFLALFITPRIGIFTLPELGIEVVQKNIGEKIILFALIFPNLVLSMLGVVPYAAHTSSIGTEEQFYLVWPVVLKKFTSNRLALMISIVAIYFIISLVLGLSFFSSGSFNHVLRKFWSTFNIDCMAIGGFYAVMLFQNNKFLRLFLNQYLFYTVLFIVIIFLIKGIYIPYIHYEFYSALFGILILNLAANTQLKISLENRLFNYLGKISYGLYMYHPYGIVLAIYFAVRINFVSNWLVYPLSLLITIAIAGLSFSYFESTFLKYKNKFSNILSGADKPS